MQAPGPRELFDLLGGETPPGTIGRSRGPLLVLGTARCLWDDLEWLGPWAGAVMAINDAIAHYAAPISDAFSLYPDLLPAWLQIRATRFQGVDLRRPETHAHRGGHIDRVWPVRIIGGGSGLAAALAGLMKGHERVILAGVPMAAGGHFYDPLEAPTGNPTREAPRQFWRIAAEKYFGGRVTSLSGWTRELLGAPSLPASREGATPPPGLAVIDKVARLEAGVPLGAGP